MNMTLTRDPDSHGESQGDSASGGHGLNAAVLLPLFDRSISPRCFALVATRRPLSTGRSSPVPAPGPDGASEAPESPYLPPTSPVSQESGSTVTSATAPGSAASWQPSPIAADGPALAGGSDFVQACN